MGQAIAPGEHDVLLVGAGGNDRHDGHPGAEGELEEPLAPAQYHLAAISEWTVGVQIGSWVHEQAAPRGEGVERALVAGAQHAQTEGVLPEQRVLEEEIVRQRVDRPLWAVPVVDRPTVKNPSVGRRPPLWLPTRRTGPVAGTLSTPWTRTRK